jgi:hypothetical protein
MAVATRSKSHKYTDEERELIRCAYDGTRESKEYLMSKIGVSYHSIKHQICKLGVAKCTFTRSWSDKDKELLAKLSGQCEPAVIAKRLGRSVPAVRLQMNRLGLSSKAKDGWYNMAEVAWILGKPRVWVRKQIRNGTLRATSHYEKGIPGHGGAWHIEERDLKDFIRTYPYELTGRNTDIIAIVDILAGVAPREDHTTYPVGVME